MQLYEEVWSTGDVARLDRIMTEDHDQLDVIWQPDRGGGGRTRMAEGITAFRRYIPDLQFTVQNMLADTDAQQCVVEWQAAGTQLKPAQVGSEPDATGEGEPVAFRGISVLQVLLHHVHTNVLLAVQVHPLRSCSPGLTHSGAHSRWRSERHGAYR